MGQGSSYPPYPPGGFFEQFRGLETTAGALAQGVLGASFGGTGAGTVGTRRGRYPSGPVDWVRVDQWLLRVIASRSRDERCTERTNKLYQALAYAKG